MKLLEELKVWKDHLDQHQDEVLCAKNKISDLLLPIVKVLHPWFTESSRFCTDLAIDEHDITKHYIEVHMSWSNGAGSHNERIIIPLEIIHAADQIEAAKQYMIDKASKEKQDSRESLRAERDRLNKLLGE